MTRATSTAGSRFSLFRDDHEAGAQEKISFVIVSNVRKLEVFLYLITRQRVVMITPV